MAGLTALLPLLPLLPLPGGALPAMAALPPTPPPPLTAPTIPAQRFTPAHRSAGLLPRHAVGDTLLINGLPQRARWQLEQGELWLPLEVLEGQLGVSRSTALNGDLQLEWFGQRQTVVAGLQRSLADEVAVPALPLLRALGVELSVSGSSLSLALPVQPLQDIRRRDRRGGQRVVLDLGGPSPLRRGDGLLELAITTTPAQRQRLEQLGLAPRQQGDWLALRAEAAPLSLAAPWRLVLDLPTDSGAAATTPGRDPRLAALLGQGLRLERQQISLGSEPLLIHSVRLDPRTVPLDLRPLTRPDGMQGLSSLSQLARTQQAVIAINGGYFNRVNRLPLGALRDGGTWLSGPILNRGAMGWEPGGLPRFGRLRLEESLEDEQGQLWPLTTLNSGFVQKGIARYTAAWGRFYQPISGQEMAVSVRGERVVRRYEANELTMGVALVPGEDVLVARGGLNLPWQPGERLRLRSRSSHPLGLSPFVIGGGPLLLQDGQLVLNGGAEGFGSAFLSQGAPRTVIASDGTLLWLITLQGVGGSGPTLLETALVLQQQGLRDALNLDGGSSTGLVVGQEQTVRGRGVAAAVHNGLGLVPRPDLQEQATRERGLVAGP